MVHCFLIEPPKVVGGEWNASFVLAGVAFDGKIVPAAGCSKRSISYPASPASPSLARFTVRSRLGIFLASPRTRSLRSSNGAPLPLTRNLPDDLLVPNTNDVVLRDWL